MIRVNDLGSSSQANRIPLDPRRKPTRLAKQIDKKHTCGHGRKKEKTRNDTLKASNSKRFLRDQSANINGGTFETACKTFIVVPKVLTSPLGVESSPRFGTRAPNRAL